MATPRLHWIDTGQWPAALAITSSNAAYRRFMRQHCGEDVEAKAAPVRGGFCQQLSNEDGDSVLVIVVHSELEGRELVCTVAHEATHAMRWILKHAHEHEPGTETEAYLVEHIVREGLKALLD